MGGEAYHPDLVVIGIDPGTEQSAIVEIRAGDSTLLGREILPNHELLECLRNPTRYHGKTHYAIEMIASYGMAVGAEVFETCVWIGRFTEALCRRGRKVERVYRREVKLELCASPRAKDANVRQALIDLYGPGKEKAIGLKATPGPLYGMKADMWQALGVAVTYARTRLEEK